MFESHRLERILDQARGKEKRYDWIEAAELYKQALQVIRRGDFSERGEIQQRIGFCFQRAAFQAENQRESEGRRRSSVKFYSKAIGTFEKLEDPVGKARIAFCKAMVSYNRSWLAASSSEKKDLLVECWKLEREALEFYEGANDRLNLAKTCSELSMCLIDRLNLEWDTQTRKEMLEEALGYGEKAIAVLSEEKEERELARAYCLTSFHYYTGASGLELEERRKHEQKALSYSENAVALSEKVGDRFLLGMSRISLGSILTHSADSPDSAAAKHFESALQCGIDTRDNYLIGRASYLLASSAAWKMVAEEDPEKIREESEKCTTYCEDAVHHFGLIPYDQEIASSFYWYAENYNTLAKSVETHLKEQRTLLRKSIEAGKKGLEFARRSGSITATWLILHPLSKSLLLLADLETDPEMKKRLLEESLRFREENIKTLEQAMPHYFWNLGVRQHYLALIQGELAGIVEDEKQKAKLLEDAIRSAEKCINLCSKHGTLGRGQYAILGEYYSDFGGIFNQLHLLTGTDEVLGKSIEIFRGAVETYEKAGLPSRVAESHWQMAKAHNKLRNYVESAESFAAASRSFKAAAKKLPRLKGFYLDYAIYMQAWSEIERARLARAKATFSQARKRYKKAADLLETTRLWRYLAPNYSAWAQLENGEDFSRREESQRAIKAFENAAKLFGAVRQTIEMELDNIQRNDEKAMAMELSGASSLRREYCLGRITIEKAKMLDKLGDHAISSKRYGWAAKKFEEMAEVAENEADRKELRPTIYLCQAWQRMTLAEAEMSPDLYMEAAELFMKAKECSLNEKVRVSALGNSCFCKALKAGAKFEVTRDRAQYLTATQHLESAASYYAKAGLKSATEYAKATQRLFDAYLYVDDAKKERDAEKKAKYYIMAERVLEISVASYLKAKHHEKSNAVQRLLEDVREERQLAVSLSEMLHAPPIAAATATLSPLPTREEAAGLMRFQHADIQANLVITSEEAFVGEDLEIEIELVNTGKSPAFLIKVAEIIPQGFELKKKPERYRMEDRHLNMKGKRLGPLRTEELKLVLKPMSTGSFIFKPRIIYLDETGKRMSHEPKSAGITVKELGIRGWIKGKR